LILTGTTNVPPSAAMGTTVAPEPAGDCSGNAAFGGVLGGGAFFGGSKTGLS